MAIVAAVALLAAWPASASSAPHSAMPTVRLTITGIRWPATLDPAFPGDYASAYVLRAIGAGLVKLLPNGRVAPSLATWTVDRDHRVYTFTLRRRLRFSNNDPITAADVLFSLDRTLAPATHSPIALTYLGDIQGARSFHDGTSHHLTGVRVVNSRVVRITLDRPIAYFLEALAFPTADILDARTMRGATPNRTLSTRCAADVGAGQLMVACSRRGAYDAPGGALTLIPNPHYAGRRAHVRVQFVPAADGLANVREYAHGVTDQTPILANVRNYEHKPGFHSYPTSDVQFLTPDTTRRPFNNVHCRLAVAYAIDRDIIAGHARGGAGPLYDMLPRGMLGYSSGQDDPRYDPARAERELSRCPGGVQRLQLPFPAGGSPAGDRRFEALAGMWATVGIDIRPEKIPYDAFLRRVGAPLSRSHTALIYQGWEEDYPDPEDYCSVLLRSGSPYNIGGYHNGDYDRLVDRAATTFDSARRARLYQEAQHIALSQGAFIPLFGAYDVGLLRPSIHGFVTSEAEGVVPRDDDWSNVSVKS